MKNLILTAFTLTLLSTAFSQAMQPTPIKLKTKNTQYLSDYTDVLACIDEVEMQHDGEVSKKELKEMMDECNLVNQ